MLTKFHDALRLRTSPVIFFGSAAIIIAFVVGTIAFTEPLNKATTAASNWLLTNLGWCSSRSCCSSRWAASAA